MYDDRIVNQIDNLLYFRFISKVCMWGGQKVRDYLQPLKKNTSKEQLLRRECIK